MLLVRNDPKIIHESSRVKRVLKGHTLIKKRKGLFFFLGRDNEMELNSDNFMFDWPFTCFSFFLKEKMV